jgi:hypothetical protein
MLASNPRPRDRNVVVPRALPRLCHRISHVSASTGNNQRFACGDGGRSIVELESTKDGWEGRLSPSWLFGPGCGMLCSATMGRTALQDSSRSQTSRPTLQATRRTLLAIRRPSIAGQRRPTLRHGRVLSLVHQNTPRISYVGSAMSRHLGLDDHLPTSLYSSARPLRTVTQTARPRAGPQSSQTPINHFQPSTQLKPSYYPIHCLPLSSQHRRRRNHDSIVNFRLTPSSRLAHPQIGTTHPPFLARSSHSTVQRRLFSIWTRR